MRTFTLMRVTSEGFSPQQRDRRAQWIIRGCVTALPYTWRKRPLDVVGGEDAPMAQVHDPLAGLDAAGDVLRA